MAIYLSHTDRPSSVPMAHIAACLLDSEADDFSLSLNNYIAKAVSPQSSDDSVCNHFNKTCRWPKLTQIPPAAR